MKVNSVIIMAMLLLIVLPLQAQWDVGGVLDLNLASISVDPEPSSDYSFWQALRFQWEK